MEDLNFSQAQESDIPVITDVLTEATQHKVSLGDTSWGDEGWFHHEIQERMDDGSTFYLVKQDDEVIGTVSLSWKDERNWGDRDGEAGYIHQLAIKHGHHGKDVGGKIMDWLTTEATRAGKQFLRLDCAINNEGLCKYYEKHGFVRVGTSKRPDNEMGTYEAALYERSLV